MKALVSSNDDFWVEQQKREEYRAHLLCLLLEVMSLCRMFVCFSNNNNDTKIDMCQRLQLCDTARNAFNVWPEIRLRTSKIAWKSLIPKLLSSLQILLFGTAYLVHSHLWVVRLPMEETLLVPSETMGCYETLEVKRSANSFLGSDCLFLRRHNAPA